MKKFIVFLFISLLACLSLSWQSNSTNENEVEMSEPEVESKTKKDFSPRKRKLVLVKNMSYFDDSIFGLFSYKNDYTFEDIEQSCTDSIHWKNDKLSLCGDYHDRIHEVHIIQNYLKLTESLNYLHIYSIEFDYLIQIMLK